MAEKEELKFEITAEARERVGNKWMALMEKRIDEGTINATESAIVVRLLIASGYTLDPTRIPKDLQSKLTEDVDLTDPATAEELGIIPIRRQG